MTQFSIEWYRGCAQSQRRSLDRKKNELARLSAEIDRMEMDLSFYEGQIQEAVAVNKSEFDQEKFGG